MAQTTGGLTVLSGPSAVGKTTISQDVRERYPEVWISVSVTTRPPRPGEVEGVHYHFISENEFTELVDTGQMLEWAIVHGAYRYGTPREPVLEVLAAGKHALLEIDLQGARQVRETMPDAQFIFLAPPSWEELERRQIGRGTEDEGERLRRLETAEGEMAAQTEFDHVVVNNEVHHATDELIALMGITPH